MLQVMELMGKQRINPADGNYVPSGFKEYDKRTNGFARRTLTIISGWTLADSRNLQLDIVYHAAVVDCRPPSSVLDYPGCEKRYTSCWRRPTYR